MVKIAPRDADRQVARPDPSYTAFLVFGPDRGLAHERADGLTKNLLEDPDDPFALTQLTEEDLKADPASLADAMAAMSLTGGARLVRVRLSGETGSGPVLDVLGQIEAGQDFEARLVVESGDLTPRGKLRKAFEPAKRAGAIACYADNSQSLGDLADEMLRTEGLSLDTDARASWLPKLEGDRAMARNEIEKLILYKGLRDQRQEGDDLVRAEDVDAVAADHGDSALDAVIGPLFDGDLNSLDSSYARAMSAGVSPVAVLRAIQRRLDQFGIVHANGGNDGAIARSGAPRFGPQAAQFKRQMGFWQGRRLDAARELAFDLERQIKRSGSPSEALTGDLVLRLARGAARARR